MHVHNLHLPRLAASLCMGATLFVAAAGAGPSSAAGIPAGGFPNDPWGDVDGNGIVTSADATLVNTYLGSPGTLTAAQKERVRRYGDVANVVNTNSVGNGAVNVQDTLRHVLLAGGVIDAGTAGAYAPSGGSTYGDVNGDGKVDIADAVLMQRFLNGKVTDPVILARIAARGNGDISPTIPYISFGNGAIGANDSAVIADRAAGTEANPPAYVDYWPMHSSNPDNPFVISDHYLFTDVHGLTGDMNNQITYFTMSPIEHNGYTVTEVAGTDNSVVGVFKGADGSIYAMYIRYPYAYNAPYNNPLPRWDFQSPVKILDARKTTAGDTHSGYVTGSSNDLGYRNVPYTVTVLANGSTTTPGAGTYTPWDKTLQLRLDIALVGYQPGDLEMQQSFFFNFEPFIGLVSRGQAPLRGAAGPAAGKPLCVLDSATVRGIGYSQTTP